MTSLCAAGAATAAQGAAVAQAAGQGCVLPVADAAPVAFEPAPPPPLPAVAPAGIGIWPLLLGLAAVTGAVLLFALDNNRERDLTPISP
ncbi:MAG TPA: hypothetical protein VM346_08880 [Sphingomicrobium sp.]|nr:hypothetical protein [Sphingomicrobium sp.]